MPVLPPIGERCVLCLSLIIIIIITIITSLPGKGAKFFYVFIILFGAIVVFLSHLRLLNLDLLVVD